MYFNVSRFRNVSYCLVAKFLYSTKPAKLLHRTTFKWLV